ncbi:energy transducer TonB [Acidithiobacillus sulfuriphilus]|uniref:energy transducer TonB n=1 Tax=Acidithiobacillus sulfuriphilus TaxID=1867749 RepID=UPI003F5E0209
MPNDLASLTAPAIPETAIFRAPGRLPWLLAGAVVLVVHGLVVVAFWHDRPTAHLPETVPVSLCIHLAAATAPLPVPSVKRDSPATPRHATPPAPPAGTLSPLPNPLAEADISLPKAAAASASPPATSTEPAPPAAGQEPPTTAVVPPGYGARYLHNPAPDYPLAARRAGQEGTVVLRVLVSADGLAEQIGIHRSSGFAILDQAAATAIRQWHFVPARQGAGNVAAWVNIPMTFRLEEN